MKRRFLVCFILILSGALGTMAAPKKVFYINSYHLGYPSSDDITEGVQGTLVGENVDLEVFFMDTKNNTSEEFIRSQAQKALEMNENWKPDVIIASDDNAVKYVVEPHLKDGPIPVIFCGVNWSAEKYGLPTDHVSGMLEVLPIEPTVNTLREYYPDMKTVTVLSENTNSERSNKEVIVPIFEKLGLQVTYTLVDTFAEWKTAFRKANEMCELIFIPTNGAIKNWNEEEAKTFVKNTIQQPVFTCDDFMMQYAVFGQTKIAQEQGEWAARQALNILNGASPADIPVTKNKETKAYLNLGLAKQIGFEPNKEMLEDCKIVK